MEEEQNALYWREWVAIVLLVSWMGTVGAISYFSHIRIDDKMQQVEQMAWMQPLCVAIEIQGAVQFPGTYYVEPGRPIRETLKKAQLLKSADRRLLRSQRIVYCSEKVVVPYKERKRKKGDS